MSESISETVISGVILGLLGVVGLALQHYAREFVDRRKVYQWLRENTREEPGKSHVDTTTLAKGTQLPEDRVRRACMSDKRIHCLLNGLEQWSVWRKEKQSIYDKRGLSRL